MEGKVKRGGKKSKKKRFRARPARPFFWDLYPKKWALERQKIAAKGLLRKKRNGDRFLVSTS